MVNSWFRKVVCWSTLMAFAITGSPCAHAGNAVLTAPGTMVGLSETYRPPVLKGVKVYPDEPMRLDFILERGDAADTANADGLVKYFLAALAVPDKDLWVNLSPYEKDRIVPEAFGQTETGRDLLAQDYLLKQLTASLLYPEGEAGRKFWAKVYAAAADKYGTTDIPVDTFNKVWIVPDRSVVYENAAAGVVYITGARLKVMLETDYLATARSAESAALMPPGTEAQDGPASGAALTQEITKSVLREIIIPILEKEVNEGRNFARLRQVYHSLILAAWYKQAIKESLLARLYVDSNKVKGVDIDDPREGEKIWAQYVEAFKKGAFDLVREEKDAFSDDVLPRKYFSGGMDFAMKIELEHAETVDLTSEKQEDRDIVEVDVRPVAVGSDGRSLITGFNINYGMPKAGLDSDNEMRGLVEEFFKNDPGELLRFLRAVSGKKDLRFEDINKDVGFSFFAEGTFKDVYRMEFAVSSGEHFNIILAVKKAKEKNAITSHEMNNLKKLDGRGVPKWGGMFYAKDGRTIYVEEFIEGVTVKEYGKVHSLDRDFRKKIMDCLLGIASGLGGMSPRDIHDENFMIRNGSQEVVLVDIGNKRLTIAGKNATIVHQLLFLGIVLAQYGSRDDLTDNHVFLEAMVKHPLFKNGIGMEMLRDLYSYMQQRGDLEIQTIFSKEGRQLFNPASDGRGPEGLAVFVKSLRETLRSYLENNATIQGGTAKDAAELKVVQELKPGAEDSPGIDPDVRMTAEDAGRLWEELQEQYVFYHGTSWNNEAGIREHGLDLSRKPYDDEDVRKYQEYFHKAMGREVPFAERFMKNDIYLTTRSENARLYAKAGPEIIQMMLARINDELLPSQRLTVEEKDELREILRKYQGYMDSHRPLVVRIKGRAYFKDKEAFVEKFLDVDGRWPVGGSPLTVQRYKDALLRHMNDVTVESVGPEDIAFPDHGQSSEALDPIDVQQDLALDPADLGGIDLTAERMALETNGAGKAIQFNIDPAQWQAYQSAPGLMPVIIGVEPMDDLGRFLGMGSPSGKANAP